jgi:hypothetical protein
MHEAVRITRLPGRYSTDDAAIQLSALQRRDRAKENVSLNVPSVTIAS